MFLFRFFSSFLPLQNPIGFGASDFIELALAALLGSLGGGVLLVVLLDAAGLDHAGMGAGRRSARGVRIRSSESVDEQFLGRRSFRDGRLSGVRIAAAPAGSRPDSRRGFVGPGSRI